MCNNSTLSNGGVIGDTTEGALLVAAGKAFDTGKLNAARPRLSELPFSSARKMMSTVHKVSGKRIMYAKGAPEILLGKCTEYMKDGKEQKLTPAARQSILQQNESLATGALRVLGIAYKELGAGETEENGLIFLGLEGMIDPPREEVKADFEKCKGAGIKVIVITGDNQKTAQAIARQLGLEGGVLTGEDLEKMGDEELVQHVDKVLVYARVSPEDKLRVVGALKAKGHVVAMMGDGVNDAPALKKADIGVAMGIKGTDVAKEASDMVLRDDNFGSVVSAIEGGRMIYDNIRKFILYLLSSNMAEVMVIFLAMALLADPATGSFVLPLVAVQILWMNLITDGLPALALGFDKPAKGIMERPPRSQKESLLGREAFGFIGLVSIVMTAGTLGLFWAYLPYGENVARTVAFTTLVVFELFNVFNARLAQGQSFEWLSNKRLLAALGSSALLQLAVIYFQPLQAAFGTTPLGIWEWALIIPVSASVLVVVWLRKKLGKKRH